MSGFAFKVSDKDGRPWEERGFTEVKPVATYANQSEQNERSPAVGKDGHDPVDGYPERQKKSPDAGKK